MDSGTRHPADGLKELQDANVVVLWRPFHEMNGGWFWWGGKDPDEFIRVWRHMFDYFTKTKGLDNLLWVYGPTTARTRPRTTPATTTWTWSAWTPTPTSSTAAHQRLRRIIRLPKPFGFTEFGPHGPQNPPGDYDYRRFLDGVEKNFPRRPSSSRGMELGAGEEPEHEATSRHPWIVNREDLPAELATGQVFSWEDTACFV